MAQELIPLSVNSDDNLRITAVAWADDARSVADLALGDDLTYSLKTFNRSTTETEVADPRLALSTDLSKRGRSKETIEVQGIFGDDDDVAYALCKTGVRLNVAVRYSLPNATAWAAAQTVDVLHIECGKLRKDAPVENGIQTYTQTWYVIKPSEDDVATTA